MNSAWNYWIETSLEKETKKKTKRAHTLIFDFNDHSKFTNPHSLRNLSISPSLSPLSRLWRPQALLLHPTLFKILWIFNRILNRVSVLRSISVFGVVVTYSNKEFKIFRNCIRVLFFRRITCSVNLWSFRILRRLWVPRGAFWFEDVGNRCAGSTGLRHHFLFGVTRPH